MFVSSLHTYPVKSFQGLDHHKVDVGPKGAEWDRRWMVVDGANRFITQRQNAQMAQISTEITPHGLTLSVNGQEPLHVPFPKEGRNREVVVWNDICNAWDQGDSAAEWISKHMGMDCRLMFIPDSSIRSLKNCDGEVGFADTYPFLLTSEASLDDLNQKMEAPLPMNRFRANIVIQGLKPYEEDTWKSVRIGNIEFIVCKPCSRCVATTTDQYTGKRGEEPLKTLATYRKQEKGIMFGQLIAHRNLGILRVGDRVEVLEFKN